MADNNMGALSLYPVLSCTSRLLAALQLTMSATFDCMLKMLKKQHDTRYITLDELLSSLHNLTYKHYSWFFKCKQSVTTLDLLDLLNLSFRNLTALSFLFILICYLKFVWRREGLWLLYSFAFRCPVVLAIFASPLIKTQFIPCNWVYLIYEIW